MPEELTSLVTLNSWRHSYVRMNMTWRERAQACEQNSRLGLLPRRSWPAFRAESISQVPTVLKTVAALQRQSLPQDDQHYALQPSLFARRVARTQAASSIHDGYAGFTLSNMTIVLRLLEGASPACSGPNCRTSGLTAPERRAGLLYRRKGGRPSALWH